MTTTTNNDRADDPVIDEATLDELMSRVDEEGLELLGPDGVLTEITSKIMNRALETEMADHRIHRRHRPQRKVVTRMIAKPATTAARQRRTADVVQRKRSVEDRLRSNYSLTKLAAEARRGRSRRTPLDTETLIGALRDCGVEYVIVGGIGAIIHGANRATFDLDVVPSTTAENLDALARALESLGAKLGLDDGSTIEVPIDRGVACAV